MSEIDRLTQELIAGNRVYFSLLRNFQHGSHDRIMVQLAIQRELEQQLIALVGREATFELEAASYQLVLSEYS